MALQETFEICLDGDGFRIIPVTEDQVQSRDDGRGGGVSSRDGPVAWQD